MAASQSAPGSVPVTLASPSSAEVFYIGPLKCIVLEDGSHTDNRIGAVTLVVPPHTPGPPQHWHRMHDETFLVTRGRLRFTTGKESLDAGVGELVVVPPKCYHTFSNPFDDEAKFFNTFTPAYYVDYLRLLAHESRETKLSPEQHREIMARFATFPPEEEVGVGE